MSARTVNLSVDVDDADQLTKVTEVLARHLAGLALEGVEARLYVWQHDEDES